MNKTVKMLIIVFSYLVGILLFVVLSFFEEYNLFLSLIACFAAFLFFINGYLSLADRVYLGLGTTRLMLYQRFMKRVMAGLLVLVITILYVELMWVWVKETRTWMAGFDWLLGWFLVVMLVLMSQLGMVMRLLNLPSSLVFISGFLLFGTACFLIIRQIDLLLIDAVGTLFAIGTALYVRNAVQKVRMDKR